MVVYLLVVGRGSGGVAVRSGQTAVSTNVTAIPIDTSANRWMATIQAGWLPATSMTIARVTPVNQYDARSSPAKAHRRPVATSATANVRMLGGSNIASPPPTIAPIDVPSRRLHETVQDAARVDCMTTRAVMDG